MSATLPNELLDTIKQQIVLRQNQLLQLSLFYSDNVPSPRTLVAYGPEDVCIVETIETSLKRQLVEHVMVDCRDCLSQRHLLTKIFAKCVRALGKEDQVDRYDRLDSINAVATNLRKLLQQRKEKLVVILVGADQQRGATPTLFPALARLGDLVSCLSLILTSSSPRPLVLHQSGVPYIHFPPYKRNEAIQILLRNAPPLLPDPLPKYCPTGQEEKITNIYNQFATVVYDTLLAPTTNSLVKYRQTCERLWPRFIWPLVSGDRGDWDFARLLSRNRVLFQADGEEALQEHLISTSSQPRTFDELMAQKAQQHQNGTAATTSNSRYPFQPVQPPQSTHPKLEDAPLLKYFPTILLLSCYLASHTHNKHDIVLFSRLSTASSTNRRKKKYLARSRAGGISKTPTKSPSKKSTGNGDFDDDDSTTNANTPSKKKTSRNDLGINGDTNTTPKKERADRSMRAIFEKTSNIARSFTLERVIGILRAIHPDGIKMGRGIADRVYVELGELDRLRLVVRADAKSGKGGDAEEIMEEKWKCVVGREWVVQAGRRWGVGIEGWEVE